MQRKRSPSVQRLMTKVCPANGTVTNKVSFKLFKNLKISLSAPDVVEGKKCMNNASDESVNLVVNVERVNLHVLRGQTEPPPPSLKISMP